MENIKSFKIFLNNHKKRIAFCGDLVCREYSSIFLCDNFPSRFVFDVYKTSGGNFVCVKSIEKIIYSEILPDSCATIPEAIYQTKSQEIMWFAPEEKHKIVDFFGYSVPSQHIYESLDISYEDEEYIS